MRTLESIFKNKFESVFDIDDAGNIFEMPEVGEYLIKGSNWMTSDLEYKGQCKIRQYEYAELKRTSPDTVINNKIFAPLYYHQIFNIYINDREQLLSVKCPWDGEGGRLYVSASENKGDINFIAEKSGDASIKDSYIEHNGAVYLFTDDKINKMTIKNTTINAEYIYLPMETKRDFKNFAIGSLPAHIFGVILKLIYKNPSKSKELREIKEIIDSKEPSNKSITELLGLKGMDLSNCESIHILTEAKSFSNVIGEIHKRKIDHNMINDEWWGSLRL